MKSFLCALVAGVLWLLPVAAQAQSGCPSMKFKYVPTVEEWQACWTAKQDFGTNNALFKGTTTFDANGAAKAVQVLGHEEYSGAQPAAASNSVAASVAGNDMRGRITLGATPNTQLTLTFTGNWTNPPVCTAQDETSAVTMRATTVAIGSVVFTASGSMSASDKISYRCDGFY